jgi:hypothetical protein
VARYRNRVSIRLHFNKQMRIARRYIRPFNKIWSIGILNGKD